MKLISILLLAIFLIGCSSSDSTTRPVEENTMYIRINAKEAKEILESEKNVILLDVRTLEEYKERHIEGSILLPYDEIGIQAREVLPDKEAIILIYCRSGRRSAVASIELIDMGYNKVYDFGGIMDWPYETIKAR